MLSPSFSSAVVNWTYFVAGCKQTGEVATSSSISNLEAQTLAVWTYVKLQNKKQPNSHMIYLQHCLLRREQQSCV